MKRTSLKNRILPDYTRGEEIFNTASHIAGGAFGVVSLVLCVFFSAIYGDAAAIAASAVYGSSTVALYTVSAVYHGLKANTAKKVMQVIDHCAIYFLIAGTYTPITLCAIRRVSPLWGWILFGFVWGLSAVAATFTAIDLRKYRTLSMICYLGLGWCVIFAIGPVKRAIPFPGLVWIFAGGIAYSAGAVLFGLGKKIRYMHGVFHLLVLAGSVCHFVCILFYVIMN